MQQSQLAVPEVGLLPGSCDREPKLSSHPLMTLPTLGLIDILYWEGRCSIHFVQIAVDLLIII